METPTLDVRTGADPVAMPQLGFGTWEVPQEVVGDAVGHALEVGYRHIDTAAAYGNEQGVGQGLKDSGVAREDVYVTTKLWNNSHGRENAATALDKSLARLGMDYVDLYLIHWPVPSRDAYVETWEALLELREAGKASSVGVCNFNEPHLQRIADAGLELPAVNQIEVHPYLVQSSLRDFNAAHDIVTQDWSPLAARANLLDDEVVLAVAAQAGCTPAQAVLAWHLAIGSVVIPRSVKPHRIEENFAATTVELTGDQVERLSALDRGSRTGPDPDTFDAGA